MRDYSTRATCALCGKQISLNDEAKQWLGYDVWVEDERVDYDVPATTCEGTDDDHWPAKNTISTSADRPCAHCRSARGFGYVDDRLKSHRRPCEVCRPADYAAWLRLTAVQQDH